MRVELRWLMLSDDEVIKRVRAVRFSSKLLRIARKAPSVNALARTAGVSRNCLYEVARYGRMSAETGHKLRSALAQD